MKATEQEKETCFEKMQLLKSKRFEGARDMLAALLADGQLYSISEAQKLMEDFRRRMVK